MKSLPNRLRTADLLAVLALVTTPLGFYLPAALGWKVFGAGDMNNLFLPFRFDLARALAEGRLPLWTPDLQFGFPLFAEGHIAALYPLNLILFRFLPIHAALSNSSLLHLSWAAVGMYVFCRSSGLRVVSALIAGFIFSFNGFCIAHIQHLTLLAAASWLPWLLFFQVRYQRAWREGNRNWLFWFLLTGLSIGLQLLIGFLQVVLMNLLVFFALGIVQFLLGEWKRKSSVRELPAFIVIAIGSIALGAGISAVQWLPAFELLGLSVRAQELGGGFQTSFSLDPMGLTQYVSPFAWLGEPTPPNLEFYGYLGVVPFLLMLAAPLLRRSTRTLYFFLFGLLMLSLTLGDANPLYGILSYVPLYNRFRVPARFMFPFIFTSSFLAAEGLQELQNRLRDMPHVDRVAVVMGALFALPIIGIIGWWDKMPLAFWMNAWTLLPWLFVVLAVGALLLARARWVNRPRFAVIVLGLTLVDLSFFSIPLSFTVNAMVSPEEFTQAPLSIQTMDTAQTMYRMFTNIYNVTLRPNHPLIYGKQSAQIYSPLALERSEEYVGNLSASMLNLANVRYYFLPSGPLPEEFTEPTASLVFDPFKSRIAIPPTRVAQVEIISYTDKTTSLPDGFLAGEMTLLSSDAKWYVLPIRLGVETADWAHDVLDAKHSKPTTAVPFPAYLLSIKRSFDGFKYVARINVSNPLDVVAISARSYLPEGNLVIERVLLFDEAGRSVSLAALAHRNDFSVVFKSHAVTTLENRDVLPRAFVVHEAALVSDEQTLTQLRNPAFRPERTVLLSDGLPLRQGDNIPNRAAEQAAIVEYKPERVVVKVKMDQVGYLVLTDNWYPGWNAWIDGQSVTIHRADYIFRAVLVQPGEHAVVFEYHPAVLAWGAIISGMSVILVVALAIAGVRKAQSSDVKAGLW